MNAPRKDLGLLQLAGASLLLLLCLSATLHALLWSEDVPFLRRGGGAAWITAPLPQTSNLIAVDPAAPPAFGFVKRFGVEGEARPALLRVRALREIELELNGQTLLARAPGRGWREGFELDVSEQLQAGRNELRAVVRNAHGPPLLQLELQLADRTIESDASWQVSGPRTNPAAAMVARDVSRHPDSYLLAEPGEILREQALPLALLFAGCALAQLALSRRSAGPLRQRMPEITLGLVSLFWLLLFVVKLIQMPLMLGYDVPAHLVYIDLILQERALPLASEGFSTYHPPLFYVLTSVLVGLFDASTTSFLGQIVYRLIPFASGLSNVWLTWLVARRIWPGDALRISLSIATAGLLPMNLYMSAYVSNEPLHAALISVALWLATGLLLAAAPVTRRLWPLAACLGLALLTKYTSVLLAPLIAFFVAVRGWLVEREPAGRALARFAGVVGGAALLSGWVYLRNYLSFGDPLIWNLDVPGAATWWMQPGFHTADYYGSFGEALRHPFFAAYAGFWDGVYSTLWGDGLVAGMIRVSTRHPYWSYDFMTLCYWLAFPASLLIGVGFLRMLQQAYHHPDPRQRLVRSLFCVVLFLLSFSLFRITLSLPFYAQAKASYILSAVLPLSLIAAEGLALLPERLAGPRHVAARAAYFGWLGTLAGVIVVAFLG